MYFFTEKPVLEGARRTADPQRPELKKPGKTCVKFAFGAENLEKTCVKLKCGAENLEKPV